MRYTEILEACWTGYQQQGMKKKGDRMVPNCVPVSEQEMEEDLKKWFKEKWVRFGPDGKIRGACARGSKGEGKPKCLPQSKAHALGKKGRASAAAKKRREDPNPERRGPARNVATKVKEALGLYGPFTVSINTGERPQSRTKTKKFKREDDAILWAEDWLEDFPQYSFATAQVTDPDGNVVWATDESLEVQGVAEGFEYGNRVQHPKYGAGQVIQVYSNGMITVNFPNYPDPIDKKPGVQSNFGPGDKDYQSLKPLTGIKEQNDWDDADEFGMPGSEFFQDDDRLRDGDYVRDRQDGEYGEIFRMSGDPSERRVRILDRDGKGWYISPERLVAVDRTDPDIMKYFGKRRQRDMDEQLDASGGRMYQAKEKFLLRHNGKDIAFFNTAEEAKQAAQEMMRELKGSASVHRVMREQDLDEKQDACYRKVKSRYKVWPSAYASGALVQCRKKGAANWGTGGKKK